MNENTTVYTDRPLDKGVDTLELVRELLRQAGYEPRVSITAGEVFESKPEGDSPSSQVSLTATDTSVYLDIFNAIETGKPVEMLVPAAARFWEAIHEWDVKASTTASTHYADDKAVIDGGGVHIYIIRGSAHRLDDERPLCDAVANAPETVVHITQPEPAHITLDEGASLSSRIRLMLTASADTYGWSPTEIAARVGCAAPTANTTMYRLSERGLVHRDGSGKYYGMIKYEQ